MYFKPPYLFTQTTLVKYKQTEQTVWKGYITIQVMFFTHYFSKEHYVTEHLKKFLLPIFVLFIYI